jgi:hypothetical protein
MPMLSKCANPACSTQLVYLREGKIFMMEPDSQTVAPGAETKKSVRRVEHFWLCGPCSTQFTLAYDHQQGVQVVPKGPRTFQAVAC